MTSDDAETTTKEYADAAKSLAIGQEDAANRLAQAEKAACAFEADEQGPA